MPTKILEARGSWRADRPDEPEPVEGVPSCPAWLATCDAFAAQVWRDLIPLLVAQNTIALIDWMAVAGLCSNFSCWRRATELAECAEPGTPEWRRLRSAANECLMHILRLSRCFGLTPSDRAGLHVGAEENDPIDEGKSKFFAAAG